MSSQNQKYKTRKSMNHFLSWQLFQNDTTDSKKNAGQASNDNYKEVIEILDVLMD